MSPQVKENLMKVVNFLRLIDAEAKLSITNVAVYVVLVKVAIAPEFTLMDAGALFVTLLNYSGKKIINKIKEPETKQEPGSAVEERINKLQDKVNSIAVAVGITRKM